MREREGDISSTNRDTGVGSGGWVVSLKKKESVRWGRVC